jgi:hypothetical protein
MAFQLPKPKAYPHGHLPIKLASMVYRLERVGLSDLPPDAAGHIAAAKAEVEVALRLVEKQRAEEQARKP